MLKVNEDRVRLPDGKTGLRESVHHPGAVVIIALLDDETVIMERQYRYPLRRHLYELPAGKIEAGEEPLVTAQRELLEECGYTAKSWRHLTTLHPCVGYSDERIELFLARDLVSIRARRSMTASSSRCCRWRSTTCASACETAISPMVTAGLAWLQWLKR